MGKAPARLTPLSEDNVKLFKGHALSGLIYLEYLISRMRPLKTMFGFEKENTLTDRAGQPRPVAMIILGWYDRPWFRRLWWLLGLDPFTGELLKNQLEINSRPRRLTGLPFTATRRRLNRTGRVLDLLAAGLKAKLVPAGIHLGYTQDYFTPDSITPNPRYKQLDSSLASVYGPHDFRINGLKDSLLIPGSKGTVLEGATTSTQPHLTLQPDEVVAGFNAARIAAMLTVAIGSGSPALFGHLLWAETRIAVLEQSVGLVRVGPTDVPRVCLGQGWITSPAEPFRQALDYPPLIIELPEGVATDEEALSAFLLLYGTIWPWVRLVFGKHPKPHLRLEFRMSPSGTTMDDMANAAFVIGLTRLMMKSVQQHIADGLDFKEIDAGFRTAAKKGVEAGIPWPDDTISGQTREWDVLGLVLHLLPGIQHELLKLGVARREANRYLRIIHDRVESGITPAVWITTMIALFEAQGHDRAKAIRLTDTSYRQNVRGGRGRPAHTWRIAA